MFSGCRQGLNLSPQMPGVTAHRVHLLGGLSHKEAFQEGLQGVRGLPLPSRWRVGKGRGESPTSPSGRNYSHAHLCGFFLIDSIFCFC